MHPWIFRGAFAPIIALILCGCSEIAYYAQAMDGQTDLLNRRRPIATLVTDPHTPAQLRTQLDTIVAMRKFAVHDLLLPDSASYRSYADLHRPYVVKNVFVAPELSLTPQPWCFPIAGCVGYRGYFDDRAAEQLAEQWRRKGYDVFVAAIPAYSTLGWFDDPVLNTFVGWPSGLIAELIFHELAHQRLYVTGDTVFNESFATSVGRLGAERWLADRPADQAVYLRYRRYTEDFANLVMPIRDKLAILYASPQPDTVKRSEKQRLLASLDGRYQALKTGAWQGFSGYDRWFEGGFNNAKFAAMNAYTHYLSAFIALFHANGDDFAAFYQATAALAELPQAERDRRLQTLSPNGANSS
ncbi:MAG: aminopeptidase [Gammaproteobacteria bacterium]